MCDKYCIILMGAIVLGACSDSSAPLSSQNSDGGRMTESCVGDCDDAGSRQVPIVDSGTLGSEPPGPPPAFITDMAGYISDLQGGGGFLYWLQGNAGVNLIKRAPTSGGAPVTLYTRPHKDDNTVEIAAMVIDSAKVYFTDCGDNLGERGLYQIPLDGSAAPTLMVPAAAAYALAIDGEDICFVDGDSIRHVKKSGGPATTIARGVADYRTQIAVSQGLVYFGAGLESMAQEVFRFPVTAVAPDVDAGPDAGGPKPEKVSTVPGRYELFLSSTVDDGFVYWAAVDSAYRASATVPATKLFAIADEFNTANPSVLYAHAKTLYWLSYRGTTLQKQAVENGTPASVSGVPGVRSVVVDGQYLYAAGSNNIYRAPL